MARAMTILVLALVVVLVPLAAEGDNLVQDPGFDLDPTDWGTSPMWQPWYTINTNEPTWGYTSYDPFSPPYSQAWSGEPEWTQGGIYQDVYVPEAGLYEMVMAWGDHLQPIDGLGPPGPTELRWGIQPNLVTTHDPGPPLERQAPPVAEIIWFGGGLGNPHWCIVSDWGLVGITWKIPLEEDWVRFWVETRTTGGPTAYTRAMVDFPYLGRMELGQVNPLDPPEGWGPWEYIGTDIATGAESYQAVPEPSSVALLGLGMLTLLAWGWRRA